ncbi:MAG: hypothetical protein LQ350_003298 [Teloschistes chrysophthalmus]|nr:MAG: hypothetical protein LQ350_003298 [Niorma chrysophthalma]
MTAPREPNPLRPYYIPPSLGDRTTPSANSANTSGKHGSSSSASATSFGSSARNILADMDYSEMLSDSAPSSTATIKSLADQALWKYTSVFLAQPFEIAKTVLQVRLQSIESQSSTSASAADEARRKRTQQRHDDAHKTYNLSSSDSEYDSPSYFTATAPLKQTPPRQSRARRRRGSPGPRSPSHFPHTNPRSAPHTLDLRSSSSLTAVLSALWQTEGAWGIWKGTNSTYIHSILLSTITSFARSFLAAIFAVPDPNLSFQISPSIGSAGGLDILSSPAPMATLAVAVSAAGLAGIILAPLDIARTKLMLTPSTHPPRSILPTLNSLSSWTLPWSIAPTTILHCTLPTVCETSRPLFLRSNFGVDPLTTPNVYAIATFVCQAVELGIRLPIETALRRGQMHVAQSHTAGTSSQLQTTVEVGPYKGLVGTLRSIVYDEGARSTKSDSAQAAAAIRAGRPVREPERKGQGYEGLFRGWRVGMWGLVGVWGAATLGGVASKGGEF